MSGDLRPLSPEEHAATTGSRWAEVKRLFEAALGLDATERQAFLMEQAAHDPELRLEAESLLEAYENTGDFLEKPFASVRSLIETHAIDKDAPPAEPEDWRPGTRLGAYLLEREIGSGGMGSVYMATRADSEFDKRVAIKLIRAGKENDVAIRRFRHERQILARLENAYVARLIDGGSTPNGLPYFVMEYVEGQTVTQYCDAHGLSAQDRLSLFLKICSAVQYAHERNIIHRDLKPSNILVKRDGTPKLLDFGIAKIVGGDMPGGGREATIAGFRMLTPAYASPEQMRGDAATVCSDVYSLGIILYELLCGERPNLGTFQRSLANSERTEEAHLSVPLRSVVFTAIRLDPQERYPSVEALAADIRRYLSGSAPQTPLLGVTPGFSDTRAKISIAILPFRSVGDGPHANSFLASAITESLITRLSRIASLSIPSTSAVLKYAGGVEAVRAAKELRVRYVLEGSIHIFAECVRASVQLVFAEAGIAVWAAQFDEEAKDLLRLEDSIAEQVAAALIPHITGEDRERLSLAHTNSSRAHEAYLRGRWHWGRSAGEPEELARALICFMEAITLDPLYPRAHAGVADYYLRLGLWGGLPPSESFAAAIEAAETAVRLDPTLGEAHASLAFALWAYHRDYAAAEKHFNLAIIRNPDYASAHHWFGLLNSARNRPELAIANLERAHKVDPNSPVIAAALGFVHHNARQFDTALRFLVDAARELRQSPVMQEMLGWCYLQIGKREQALQAAERAVALSQRGSPALALLAHAEAASGKQERALALCDEIEAAARERYVSGYDRAAAFLAAGAKEEALRCLEKALDERDWWVCWIGVDPRWDQLRNEARFARLVGLTQPAKAEDTITATATSGAPRPMRSRVARLAAAGLLLIFLLGGFFWWSTHLRQPPFSALKFTKLTMNGIADAAVISPDGKTVTYTAMQGANTSLWRKDLPGGRAIPLIPRITGTVAGLAFTGGGKQITFVNFPLKQPSQRRLFVIPRDGGDPRQVLGTFRGPVSLSLDGRRAAFVEPNPAGGRDELWVADTNDGKRKLVTSFPYPERFAGSSKPAWSEDGTLIAFAAEQHDARGFLVRLFVVNLHTGERRIVPSPRWQWVQSIAWTRDRSALAVIGQEQDSSFQQIWYVPYRAGEVRRIGNDLDNYVGISLTDANTEMVSVQVQTASNIYVANRGDITQPVQVTPGSGRYFDLSWMPDGRILYASDSTGSADLWIMNADGSGEHQITFGTGRNYAPVVSPDGKVVAFHTNRSGNWHIWRAEVDGSNPRPLTASARDGNWPQFSTDGRFVFFHQTDAQGGFNIWKVAAAGGSATLFTKALTMHPAVSPVDGKVAAWYSENADRLHWRLAVFSPEGGQPLRVYDPTPDARPDTPLHWTPSGDAISFIDYAKGVSNIWVQPVDGRPSHPITAYTSGEIYAFDWSKQGALLFSRGLTSADVVMISDTNAPKTSAASNPRNGKQ